MGLLDFLFKKPLGNINPDDPQSYQTAYAEYTQAQMEGDAAVQQFYKKWNIKDGDHWSEIEAKMIANGQGVAAMQSAMQGQVTQGYQAAGMAAPSQVEGIGIEVYAQMVAHLERAQTPEARVQALTYFGCDEARFGRVQAGFNQLMDPSQPTGAMLAGQFQMQLALARQGG